MSTLSRSLSSEEEHSEGSMSHEVPASPSSSDSEAEYEVERILAQDEVNGEHVFLVKWQGYPDDRCTWEPRENFLQSFTLKIWEQQILAGDVLDLNQINDIEARMEKYMSEKDERRERRRAKRRKLTHQKSLSIADKPRREVEGVPTVSDLPPKAAATSKQRTVSLQEPKRSVEKGLPLEGTLDLRQGISAPVGSQPLIPRRALFHGIGATSTARRTSGIQRRRELYPSDSGVPRGFRSLREANSIQKLRKGAPDREPDRKALKLKSIKEWNATANSESALTLPSGRGSLTFSLDRTRSGSSDSINPNRRHSLNVTSHIGVSPDGSNVRTMLGTGKSTDVELGATSIGISASKPQQDAGQVREPLLDYQSHKTRGRNGRWWHPPDLVISMRFGDHEVGDLRLVGLSRSSKAQLLGLKRDELSLRILFKQQHVYNKEEYGALCIGLSNHVSTIVSIDTYEDTTASFNDLADYLENNDVVAIWADENVSFAMVLYCSRSHFRFLEKGLPATPFDSRLRLAIRNQIPTLHDVDPPRQTGDRKALQTILNSEAPMYLASSPAIDSSIAGLDESNTRLGQEHNSAINMPSQPGKPPVRLPGNTSDTLNVRKGEAKDVPPLIRRRSFQGEATVSSVSSASESEEGIDFLFKSRYGITYNKLTQFTVSAKARPDRSKARFYLAFPLGSQAELELLRSFLVKHTLPRLIYTSMEDDGWITFYETVGVRGENVGAILIHRSSIAGMNLPGIGKLLRYENVNVFNISLTNPIPDTLPKSCLQRLFPRGMVLLITEGCMIEDRQRTLDCLEWFAKSAQSRSGNWKLMVRPNVKSFLKGKITSESVPESAKSLVQILVQIQKLSPSKPSRQRAFNNIDSDQESLSGQDEKFKPNFVISPSHLVAYESLRDQTNTIKDRDRILTEYFLSWTLQNATRYRRFVALTLSRVPEENFPANSFPKSHHIETFSPESFLAATSGRKSESKPRT